jgi:hypothetical protein
MDVSETRSPVEDFHASVERDRFGGICEVEVGGCAWRVATDSLLLVAAKGEGGRRVPPDYESYTKQHLTPPETEPASVLLSEIRGWAGPHISILKDVECGECGGSGTVWHECDCHLCEEDGREVSCEECAGTGKISRAPAPVRVTVDGAWFDRNQIARAVDLLSDSETVSAWVDSFAGASVLRLFAEDVRIVVCGLRAQTAADVEPIQLNAFTHAVL